MQKVYFVRESKFCFKNVRTIYLETLSKFKAMSVNIRVFWVWKQQHWYSFQPHFLNNKAKF